MQSRQNLSFSPASLKGFSYCILFFLYLRTFVNSTVKNIRNNPLILKNYHLNNGCVLGHCILNIFYLLFFFCPISRFKILFKLLYNTHNIKERFKPETQGLYDLGLRTHFYRSLSRWCPDDKIIHSSYIANLPHRDCIKEQLKILQLTKCNKQRVCSLLFNRDHLWLANEYRRLVAMSTPTKYPNALCRRQSEPVDLPLR